jgi:hypothetical protein
MRERILGDETIPELAIDENQHLLCLNLMHECDDCQPQKNVLPMGFEPTNPVYYIKNRINFFV